MAFRGRYEKERLEREAAEREAQAKAAAEKERADAEAARARAEAERTRLDREAKARAAAAEKERLERDARAAAQKEAKEPFRVESLDTDTRMAVGREALRMDFTRAAFTGIIARGEGGTDWLGQGEWPAKAVELGRKMLEAYEREIHERRTPPKQDSTEKEKA